MDEIESLIGLRPTPLTWPVVIAGDFLGVWDPPPSLPGAANHEYQRLPLEFHAC